MIIVKDKVLSTNDEARRLVEDGAEHGTTVVALEQTGGRGRQGRQFVSPIGGLYMSTILSGYDLDTTFLTIIAAVAVTHAIEDALLLDIGIKWVNDIVYRTQKIGGILAEGVPNGAIIGIGINLHTRDLPHDIGPAGSLADVAGGITVSDLAKSVRDKLVEYSDPMYDRYKILDAYRTRSIIIGRQIDVSVGDDEYTATALSIGDSGELIVSKECGEIVSLSYGEARVKKNA